MLFRKIKTIFPTMILSVALAVSAGGCSFPNQSNENTSDTQAESSEDQDSESDTFSADESEGDDSNASDDTSESDGDTSETSDIDPDITGDYSDSDLNSEWSDSESDSTFISLSGSSAEISGENADSVQTDDSLITITEKGTYVLNGSSDAIRIVIDADDDAKVQLVLNGLTLSGTENSPMVVKNASKVYLTLADGTVNSINDNRESVDSSDEDESEDQSEKIYSAAIYAKCDLTVNGTGSLSVYGGYNDGIKTTKDLKLVSGTISVEAYDDGIIGKNSISMRDGSVTVTCSDDCMKSTNDDSDKGFIVIDNGSLTLSSTSGHGITAVNTVCINNGSVEIANSYEGIEGRYVVINDGTTDIYSTDDGINVSADTTDNSDSMQDNAMNPGDMKNDMTPPDNSDGTAPADMPADMPDDMTPPDDFDGTAPADMPGDMTPPDDSSSSTAAQSHSKPSGGGHGGGFGGGFGGMDGDGIDGSLIINGGTLTVNAGGDGLDSNGDIQITGGYTVVSGSTDGGNAALDYATGCTMTGGVLLLSGNRSMATYLGDDSTVTMLNGATSANLEAGTEISLLDSDGNVVYSWTADKKCNYLQAAGPDIDSSATYTFMVNGESIEATTDQSAGGFGGHHF